jgi:DNA-binding protein H-NS
MEIIMRKPRDFDSELKALTDKAKLLKERKVQQLGELVIATGADALDPETLAGALLAMMGTDDGKRKEAWRERGKAFFQVRARKSGRSVGGDASSAAARDSGAASA